MTGYQASTQIDWDNIDVKKYTALELNYIRSVSYYRYEPPNAHYLYLMLAMMLITFSSMFYAMHMHWWIFNMPGEFPKYHKTGFWTIESLAFIGGWVIVPFWRKRDKRANIEWKEMQAIRWRIDEELKTR